MSQLLLVSLFSLVGCSDSADSESEAVLWSGGTAAMGTGGAPQFTGGASASGGSGTGGSATGGVPLSSGSGGMATGGSPGGGSATGGSGGGVGGTLGSGGSDGSGGDATGGDGGEGTGGTAPFYTPCPDAGTPCAVLPLGDSITEGFASSGGGYRVELFRQAVLAGKDITFVGTQQNGPNLVEGTPFPKNHQGHGGYTIDTDGGHSGISGSITNGAIDNFGPHIVLLMIGTNDINGNVDVANAPNRLGNLIDDITDRAPETLVVVATIVPVVNSGTNAKVITYNSGAKDVVAERTNAGKHVILLDNYAAIFETSGWESSLMADNLHPNDAGYAVLGRSFYDAIESYLP